MKNQTLKDFTKYVSANVVAMIGLSCYILADTFFISKKLGEAGLAALNLSMPSFSLVFSLGMLFAIGGATRFAIHKGAGDTKRANSVFTHTVIIVGCFATIFVLLDAFLSGPIATFLGADGATYDYSNTYVQIILCFAPFFMFNNTLQNFVRNDGAPRLAMIASLTGNLFNILFDYILIFPCNMGMLGAALATGFSPIVSMSILSIFFLRKKNSFRIEKTKISIRTYGGICSLGLASFISEFGFGIVMMLINKLFISLGGDTAVAAFAIIINVFYVVNAIFNGVASGTQPMISFSYGENDHKKIRQVLRYALITIAGIAVVMYRCGRNCKNIQLARRGAFASACVSRYQTVLYILAVFRLQSALLMLFCRFQQRLVRANYHDTSRCGADYSNRISICVFVANYGTLACHSRRRIHYACRRTDHILCHAQEPHHP